MIIPILILNIFQIQESGFHCRYDAFTSSEFSSIKNQQFLQNNIDGRLDILQWWTENQFNSKKYTWIGYNITLLIGQAANIC